ncbi:MAG: NAD(P)H-dependent oxidoreductase subunit E [Eubacteriales bacterium]|nr:NAD(P)H-dependent oxidoreductase subunit E [Eubacteriales bacterium]
MSGFTQEMYAELDKVIVSLKGQEGAVMRSLQGAQDIFGCVTKDIQVRIAEGLNVPLSEVYGVATFYAQFSLEPRGQYIIGVCMGTACYVKGSKDVLEKVSETLATPVGKTTSDGLFTIRDTRCLGACGLAPVMMINDDVYGRLTPDKVPAILASYKKEA